MIAAALAAPLLGQIGSIDARAAAPAIPETRAGAQLAWAIDQLNGGYATLKLDDVAARFAPLYLSGLPPQGVIDTFAYLAPLMAPVSAARFEGGVTDQHANALLKTKDGYWRIRLGLDFTEPYQINDFFLEEVALPVPPERPRSWAGIDSRFKSIAPTAAYIAAEITDGALRIISQNNAGARMPIASSFKLYVLGTIAKQVASGTLTWDTRITISDDLRSLPSGDLRYVAAGEQFPLEYVTERMISQSDNTATDHLIHAVGRENVEAMLATMGSSEPDRNIPLLYTREWFAMRMRFTSDQVGDYLAASVSERRAILQDEVDLIAATLTEDEFWPGPAESDRLEWFATAGDLSRAVAYLQPYAASPEMQPVANAFSLNPGVVYPPDDWTFVGFKEGYETGLKVMIWLLQRVDGRWFTLIGMIHDETQEINGSGLKTLMDAAVTLLAKAD